MLPAQLVDEVKALCEGGLTANLIESDGMANVEIINYPVPSKHFNKTSIGLLLRLSLSYPNGKPDMFWVDEDFVLKDGKVPNGAKEIEIWLGRRRRRFSWHLKTNWNPGTDNLLTYLEFVNSRLTKPE
ncbi:MAG: E2/UBC family protein [Actinomycetota bacterium]